MCTAVYSSIFVNPKYYYLHPLLDHFTNTGYNVLSHQLPSVGSSTPKAQYVTQDASFICKNLLLPELDLSADVVFVMQSYGGLPGAAAARGLSEAERGEGGYGIPLIPRRSPVRARAEPHFLTFLC